MPAVAGAVAFLGSLFLPTTAGFVLSLAVGATVLGVVAYQSKRVFGLKEAGGGVVEPLSSHQSTVRGTVEPRKLVYGEALVSGPIWYMNATGGDFRTFYAAIALTGHEVESFEGVWLDDKYVPWADVDDLAGGGDGSVDADTNSHGYGPVGGTPVLYLREHLGTAAQTVDTALDGAFADIGTNHRLRGCAYIVVRADKLEEGSRDAWEKGFPARIAVVVRGRRLYDPRLDSTFSGTWGTGSGAHRVATPSTWAWSRNPALALADYLIDTDLGPGIPSSRIDYNSIALAADICDASVSIPGSTTEPRYRCDGVLVTSDTHRRNIEKILSSFDGTLRFVGGLYQVLTGTQPVVFFLDESHQTGELQYRYQPQREDRYNAVRGVYLDPTRRHKESQYLTVHNATLRADRDDDLVLYKDLDLPMTSGEYNAQRLAIRAVNKASLTGIVVFPTGYNGLKCAVGDVFAVSNDELSWTQKNFRCIGLRHVDLVGVEIIGQEHTTTAFADPAVGDYGTRSAAGTIDFPTLLPDVYPAVGQLLTDPFFDRYNALFDGASSDTNFARYAWAYSVSANASASIVAGDGIAGGSVLQMSLDAGAGTRSVTINSIPTRGHLGVGREFVVVTARLRRTSSTSMTGTGALITLNAGLRQAPADGFSINNTDSLTISRDTVAGWTLNQWYTVSAIHQLSSDTETYPYVGVQMSLSGDSTVTIQCDAITLQRTPDPAL